MFNFIAETQDKVTIKDFPSIKKYVRMKFCKMHRIDC